MRTKVIAFFVICLMATSIFAADIRVGPYGVSPRFAHDDETGFYEKGYNGLLNVGVGTLMYLKGMSSMAFAAPTWTIDEAPAGSEAAVSEAVEIDTSNQVVKFTPDVAGKYVIIFGDGADADTVVINAGTYVSVTDGNCGICHNAKFTAWEETGHADMLVRGLNGQLGSYYNEGCISCHTTGYDADAVNNGFDDHDFTFPNPLGDGVYDATEALYPDAFKFANIQCESCHGPGSAHNGLTANNEIVKSLDANVCALCHNEGKYHVYPEQWDVSGHADPPSYPAGGRTYCGGCHNGAQFIQFVNGEEITVQPNIPISCAVCHDPHNATNEHQIRTLEATLANGEAVTIGGNGILCMNCHQSRREANSYSDEPHSHYGPHYVPQADMLLGTNYAEFPMMGKASFMNELPTSPHAQAVENSCVTCHMAPGTTNEDGDVIFVGAHTFSVVDDEGFDNVAICTPCHGDVGTTFDEKVFYINGVVDHDGDGVDEGLQDEVKGLMETLAMMLPAAEGHTMYDPHDDVDETWTKTQLKAAYNYDQVYYDHSYGIHNPAFTIALLKESIMALGGSTGVEMADGMPNEFALDQNYPNPFNPTTQIIYTLAANSEVKLTVYSILGEEIKTLVSESKPAGTHAITWDGTNQFGNKVSSGVYLYRLEAGDFTQMKKMMLVK